jgi:nitroreductase
MNQVRTVAEVIRERRSIREFKADELNIDMIIDLLQDAKWAPNHGLREPWRIIMFHGEGKKKFTEAVLSTYSPDEKAKVKEKMTNYLTGIPVHLLVVMKEDPRQKQWEEDFSATSAFIQNLQLLAWEQQIGVVWKTNGYNWHPSFREAVSIKPGEKVVGTLHLGYFEKMPQAKPRTDIREKITIHA